ncbi:hypothetical protein UA08_03109 [Talaromyces atroroseus]|uniref:FAD dependent oxidoreductase domain-containing protein n=1 Tax=Talaromyces atroroseus TaxID=1441469 RepID=A0A225AIH5_TALAT|nr:hypothetical protein UA08_03109 [Talaromyces atroroseus]OKL61241.1 hypothetical protein UA08_03109 [Talaromyces atroroseus]
MADQSIHRVAVIGAGISGVVTAAHLKSEGLDVTVFERAPVSGGVCLKNNVPTDLLELSLNTWKPNTESFANHRVLAEYIQDTASKTGIAGQTLFNTKVERVNKQDGKWRVETRTWDHDTQETAAQHWVFEAVVVASGHYHAPKTPSIPGLAEWKTAWPSRTVLLIGGSASSLDIAKELSLVTKKVWQSTRGGAFDHPESSLPENATRVGQVAQFGPLQTDPPSESSAIPGTVTLANGQVLENIDRVIVATGYQFSLPFLSEYHRDDQAPEQADDLVLVTDGLQLHNLHKDIFYIPDPTLTFVGVPFYTATFSLFEFQAIAVAAFLSDNAKLPADSVMRAEYLHRVKEKGYGKKFHSLWGKDIEYAAELMRWVNEGRAPSDKKPDGYSREWIETKERLMKLTHPKNVLNSGFENPEAAS